MSEKKEKLQFLKTHKWIWVVIAVILIAVAVVFVVRGRMNRARAEGLSRMMSQTQTAEVKKMDLSTSTSITGTIASADNRSVSTSVAGVEVKEVKVAVGDYVKAGDTIVTLDSSSLEEELETAQDNYNLSVEKNNKSLDDAADSVTEAKENYEEGITDQEALVADAKSLYNKASSDEGDAKEAYEKAVEKTKKAKEAYEKIKDKKDSLKKALSKAEKSNEKARKALEEAQKAYEEAEATAKDENGNVEEKVYQNYIAAQEEAQKAQADYEKAKAEYDKIEQSENAYSEARKAEEDALKAYEAASGEASAKYAQYEQSVKNQEETNERNAESVEESQFNYSITSQESANNLKSQKNQVQNAEEKVGECIVTSPISGVITSLSVEAGDTYEGGELFVVQDMTTFIVEASVDEYDISSISKDMSAVVKTDATGDEELNGTVTFVAPTPESSQSSEAGVVGNTSSSGSAQYKIQITLADTNEKLRIGMTAKTSIILESVKNVLVVPYDYVQTDEDGNSYVEVTERGSQNGHGASSTKKIQVETGMESDYYVEIRSDELQEGMLVTASTASQESENSSEEDASRMPFGGMQDGGNMGGRGDRGNSGGMPAGGGPGGF